ncbi:uncharacterized protein LOC124952589 isoform X1 [Vespa velutina]|uniref:uncharacterized protein LOC124952589 isoform X1 n=2 Tax=Vespa velutina TaxID=202808 RepID=UPI001FB4642B|nr:uncharacterized protein LOC124952589 isoform X1 [Vespa velutina]XP_047358648.1 uncharacterized protein LOC124952589 isoform X1 [Vespa velutina]
MANDLILRGKDKLQEISMKLEQSHLAYLQTDDSPLKLDQRRKLEGIIKEYLYLVPNESKYMFHETADILRRSAATLQDFSGYRAATAWSAISLYAANLVAQPWRKEYRILRIYSGFYKYEVQANLIGAELMFEQMGYKHAGREVLVLEGPIDPDKVTNVSRDAIVAFVECQILKQIWESVSKNYTISWLEVLEFRENHVGNPERAIRALSQRFLEKLHQSRVKVDMYRNYHYPQLATMNTIPPPINYHMPSNNYSIPSCPSDYRCINDANVISKNYHYFNLMDHGILNRYGTYGCMPPGNKCGNIYNNPYYPTVPAYTTRVPADRLVELNMPLPVENYDKTCKKSPQRTFDMDEVDFHKRQPIDSDYDYAKVDKKYIKPYSNIEKNTHESWDFVYKNLESQGYSKDLGDREDILNKTEPDLGFLKQKPLRSSENEKEYYIYRLEKEKNGRDVKDTNNHITNGKKHHHDTLSIKKKSSSFDLSDSNRYHNNATIENQSYLHGTMKKHDSRILPMQRSHHSSEQISRITNSINNLELSESKKEGNNEDKNKWNCATCTYLNSPKREICEMCMKSKFKGNEDKPLASGGKECPKCTLVNEKNVSVCEACGESLKDSPTYI